MSETNGNGTAAYSSVDYWAKLPLEVIEHKIGLRSEVNKVFYAILRCSSCIPHKSKFAVRPLLKDGGFEAWVKRLRDRIAKRQPIQKGDLNDETLPGTP